MPRSTVECHDLGHHRDYSRKRCPKCREELAGEQAEARQAASEDTSKPKSYKPEVIADNSGEWCGNALRFRTREEAEGNVRALCCRWALVRDIRVVESQDEPNYEWIDGQLKPLPDVRVIADVVNPTVYLFKPITKQAKEFFGEHFPLGDDHQWFADAVAVEHRYAKDLAENLKSEGFVVQ